MLQNSHDRAICTRSLRATQNSLSRPHLFSPPARESQPLRCNINNGKNDTSIINDPQYPDPTRAYRPCSPHSDIHSRVNHSRVQFSSTVTPPPLRSTTSAHTTYSFRGLSEYMPDTTVARTIRASNVEPTPSGFELNVNVACSSPSKHGKLT